MMADSEMTGKKVDIEAVDLERMSEFTTDQPGLISFPHNVGSALVKPEDKGKLKGRAVSAMYEQTEMQVKQIYEQMQLLAKQVNEVRERVSVSERIYGADMSFEPLIGKIYYLYERENGKDTLSLIGPNEWGRSKPFKQFVATVKLLADHTWEIQGERQNEQ